MKAELKKKTGFIIVAGHFDIEWYQPLHSYRFWACEAFQDLKSAVQREDFKTYVLDGQVYPLEAYLDMATEDKPLMQSLIRQGKLAVGPFYTQFDEWIPSAESIVRNCLFGNRLAASFGGCMRAGYLPDNFGHPRQLPQILLEFGIDSLLFMRGMPEMPQEHPDEFLYEGLDGSTILASHFREGYSGAFDIFKKNITPIQPREVPYYKDYLSYEWHRELAVHDDPDRIAKTMIANVRRIANRYPSGIIPLISGADHLPPQINIGDSVHAANTMQDEIEFVLGTPEEYIRLTRNAIRNPVTYCMELLGSRYHYILLGALSSRSYLKRQNFACEALLERYAEPLISIASRYSYTSQHSLMREAWRYLLINSAHDSIHGSSVDDVHTDMESRFGAARQIAAGVVHDVFSYLGKRIERPWEANGQKGILSYAPIQTDFAQPVELWLPIHDSPVCIRNEKYESLPTQILPRKQAERNGKGLPRNDLFPFPAFRKVLFMDTFTSGMVQVFSTTQEAPRRQIALRADDLTLENEFLKVCCGNGVISILDKRTGKQYDGLNLLQEEADAGDAWDFSPPWIPGITVLSSSTAFSCRLVESGPVRISVEMSGVMRVPACLIGDIRSQESRNIPLTFTITLYQGIPRIDVKLKLENTAKDHRIRLCIPANIESAYILSQGQFMINERPVERPEEAEPWRQPPTRILPCRDWVAVQDASVGLAVALKGLYDYEAVPNSVTGCPDIFITLLRGFEMMGRLNMMQREGDASEAFVTPGAQCLGIHEIEWSYVPYVVCNRYKAPFLPVVQSFLYPPVAHMIRSSSVGEPLCHMERIFSWDESNLQYSAFKPCYDGDGYILRIYENQGVSTQATIRIGCFTKAWLSNLNEEMVQELKMEQGRLCIHVGAYKIVSIKLL